MILANHDYHCVEINLRNQVTSEMFAWLQTRFGPGDGTRWFYKQPKLYFTSEKDHLMFLLKWGSE